MTTPHVIGILRPLQSVAAWAGSRSGYNRRSLIETAIYRYKAVVGRRLQGRTLTNQQTEAEIGCNVLNRMTSFGMPVSVRIR
jgi:hypothetical protein